MILGRCQNLKPEILFVNRFHTILAATCSKMLCNRTRPAPPRFFLRYSASLAPLDELNMLSSSRLSMSDNRIGSLEGI